MIARKFLGDQHATASLPIVCELAISESDLLTVQAYVRSVFQDCQPAEFHGLLPTFKWRALATTNYDLVIERAYAQCNNRAQELVPFIRNGDRVDEKLRSPRGLMLLKLHGCITATADKSLPLILSVDQYLTHKHGRDRLFDHLKDLSYEHPLVFIGHSLQDPDIRQLLLELGSTDHRPRYYTVTPNVTAPERRLWEGKRISPIEGTFEEFLTTINREISSPFRGVVPVSTPNDLPISDRFIVRDPGLSTDCLEFLENDVDYVRSGMSIEDLSPKMFYRGFGPLWAAVEGDLDVRRDIEDNILLDTVVQDHNHADCRVYAVKGHAGSGKSVLLQRIAWEAAHSFGRLCLYLRPGGRLSFDAIRELSRVVDDRIFLFVDDVDERVAQLIHVLDQARRFSVPIVIFAAARTNEWNISCEELESYLTDEFEVGYLSHREIDGLLGLLEKHRALYRLESASREERQAAFVKRAGRQLLVALHEATLGKPFEDIIADEFAEIKPEQARQTYLGICFLNRFDVPVRAGIISRVYGIRFTDFMKRFFQPLEGLVFARYDPRTRDYVYVTRHPHIAEIVVSRTLSGPNEKFDMYIQMLNSINVDYLSDQKAFRRLVAGRTLLKEFPDHQSAEAVYLKARFKAREDPYLFHQMGIYEMNRPNGSHQQAADHLAQARSRAPNDRSITHSLAELELKRAEDAGSSREFENHISQVRRLAGELTGPTARVSHGFHTLAKAHIANLRRELNEADGELGPFKFGDTVKQVENVLQIGLQKFPQDPYLLSAESDLARLLSDDNRALMALQTAFDKNARSPFIAVRLAKLLLLAGKNPEAISVYKTALESGVSDKHVHFNYAKLLIDQRSTDGMEIEYHLRRAFTDGDSNNEALFWYARQLYLNGEIEEAQTRFRTLNGLTINPAMKRSVRGVVCQDGTPTIFTGTVVRFFSDYGFVTRDGTEDRVFLHIKNNDATTCERLNRSVRVSFSIGFNYWGATALDVSIE